MADLAALEARIQALEDLEAIKQLKYRYFRGLDLKLWDELAECFTEDATVEYGGGKYSFRGRTAIMDFLRTSLGVETGAQGVHHGHHPEITLTGPTTARGDWGLYNYFFKHSRGIRIGAYYHDQYVKVGSAWKIRHTGYTPLFHEEWDRRDTPSLRLEEF
jgi:hypothetical protein